MTTRSSVAVRCAIERRTRFFFGAGAVEDEISMRSASSVALAGRTLTRCARDSPTSFSPGRPTSALPSDAAFLFAKVRRTTTPSAKTTTALRYSSRSTRHTRPPSAKKRNDYRPLLPPRARVVEIGSYAGGFLRAARSGAESEGRRHRSRHVLFHERVGLRHAKCVR